MNLTLIVSPNEFLEKVSLEKNKQTVCKSVKASLRGKWLIRAMIKCPLKHMGTMKAQMGMQTCAGLIKPFITHLTLGILMDSSFWFDAINL